MVLSEIYIAGEMFVVGYPAPVALELAILVIFPLVYLVLMYLSFVSQV